MGAETSLGRAAADSGTDVRSVGARALMAFVGGYALLDLKASTVVFAPGDKDLAFAHWVGDV